MRAPNVLIERLGLIVDWYKGMISDRTGRLAYTYDPERDLAVEDGSPIRDIASIWDVELVSGFLDRSDLRDLAQRSLEHYAGYLIARDGALVLDPLRLREPSSIAHSAFMLLAISDSALAEREAKVVRLAEGILRQQRRDGSYRVYFGGEEDEGLEFYPGEAMLALMRAHALVRDARSLTSVERGFAHYRDRFPAEAVDPELMVFHANWQSQYGAPLHAATQSEAIRSAVRDYVFSLHDHVLEARFYEEIERHPMRQATVEVASALEGLNDAYSIAKRERDADHLGSYERCIRIALAWLLRAQRLDHCTVRERGGFGHSLTQRTQRIDVTGHVASGFIKTAGNDLAG